MSERTPGPKSGFLGLGHVQRMRREPLVFLSELGRTYGDIAAFRMGSVRAFLINQPELIRDVLLTQAQHFRKLPRVTKALRQVDGNGLINSEGDYWLKQRRLVQPAFQKSRLKRYAGDIVQLAEEHINAWGESAQLDISADMTHLTSAIIVKTLFDRRLTDDIGPVRESVHTLSEILSREAGSLVVWPDWLPTKKKQRKRKALGVLDRLIRAMIAERRAAGIDGGDLLSTLLSAVDNEGDGTGMTDEQARDEVMVLFNAGHDTSAAALAWLWYLVATHADVADRLAEEAVNALGDRPASFDDLSSLTFAEQVVKETIRLYPPAWTLFPRQAISNVTLGSHHLSRGSYIYIVPWVTQRDARFFPRPDEFDPDRFSAEGRVSIPDYAYIPFGAGPHVCIGNTFAVMEMTLIVATVLRRFRVELARAPEDVTPEAFLALRPKAGLPMRLVRRSPAANFNVHSLPDLPSSDRAELERRVRSSHDLNCPRPL